jgi:hypothetical protein
MFASALPERLMQSMGKLYRGRPMRVKSRKELLATIKPQHWKHLRADNGDLPEGWDVPQGLPPLISLWDTEVRSQESGDEEARMAVL